ncbi:hypothetical protein B566_EDAN002028 [Ephemera danica]|nr:hypothetical protein B566_EDAN002028 [Ephemera danica]
MMFSRITGNRAGNVITLAEYRERYGLSTSAGSSSRRGRGNIPNRSSNRQRKISTSSSSSSDLEGQNSASFCFPIEKKNSSLNHALQMLKGLDELRKERSFCDVVLVAGEEEIPAHRNVLSSFSSYFKAMFTGNLMEASQDRVVINGIDAPMLQTLIDYAYTGSVDIDTENVQSLLAAANLLGVLPVRDSCCSFLKKVLDEANCVGIHCFAEAHACTDLQSWSKQYVLMHFNKVAQYEELLSLPVAKLVEVITSDDLNVDKEEIVFNAALRWLQANPEDRAADFHMVLEQVRLPLLNAYMLHDCVRSQPALLEDSRCRSLIEEAEWYHLMPDRRQEMKSFRTKPRRSMGIEEVIVAVGGEDDKVVLRSVEFYSLHTGDWHTLACLPFAVSKHGLVASGTNHMYLAGGEFPDGTASNHLWRYDPVMDTWAEMAPMMFSRSELGLAVLDGHLYAIGGWEGTCRLDSVERFNPHTNMWEMIAPVKMAVTSPAVVAHLGKLYVTGGAVLEDGDGIGLVQRYDPKTNSWEELEPMLIPRSGSAACVLNGSIYVLGGWHASTENTNKVECYNIETNTWEFKASMCERRYRPGVAVVDGFIYILGGEEGWDRYHDTIERFCPESNTWELVGEMQTSRSWLSCVTLQIKPNAMALAQDFKDLSVSFSMQNPARTGENQNQQSAIDHLVMNIQRQHQQRQRDG